MVYVDNMEAGFKNMVMCHMVADTTEELLSMVDKIGVKRKWIQDAGTYKEHFDICLSKKKKAIKAGAREITMKQMGNVIAMKKLSIDEGYPIKIIYSDKTNIHSI